MSASDHLSTHQFPLHKVLSMDSPEFDSTVDGAVQQMHEYYGTDSQDARIQKAQQRALTGSVRAHGVTQPVHVAAPVPGEGDQHMLLNGHHRVAAAKSAGLTHVPAVVHPPVKDEDGTWDYPTYYENPGAMK
jgi:hypothetical protein